MLMPMQVRKCAPAYPFITWPQISTYAARAELRFDCVRNSSTASVAAFLRARVIDIADFEADPAASFLVLS